MALSVDKVFQFVQFVANKESRGWIAPAEFNIAAELAQIAVYSRLEAQFLNNKVIDAHMRPFVKTDTMSVLAAPVWTPPSDWRHILNMYTATNMYPVNEAKVSELADFLNSEIVAPTDAYPVYVLTNETILVYPITLAEDIIVSYIQALTTTPTWGYTTVSGRPVYAVGTSTDFEFDDNLFTEIATNILMNVGMNIGREAVAQYGMAFNAQK